MEELIRFDMETQTVSAREIHEQLNIATRFNDWFPRMCEYGFTEGLDYYSKTSKTETGGRPATDYDITIEMAKEICMIQRSPEGKKVRQYLLTIEKAWNTPEAVFARALKMANETIEKLQSDNTILIAENSEMRPKAEFFDAVAGSKDAISMANVAKILNVPGVGRNKLFEILRDRKILQQDNTPRQRYVDSGYFVVIEEKFNRGADEVGIYIKTLVTQKGLDWIRRILEDEKEGAA